MGTQRPNLTGEEMDLLRLNYQNLHQSFWDAHRAAWTASTLFLPLFTTLQGYFLKEYRSLSTEQILAIGAVLWILLSVWFLMMRVLEHYNDARRRRLKQIECALDRAVAPGFHLFQQYTGLDYKEDISRLKISPMRIYSGVFCIYSVMNGLLMAGSLFIEAG